VTKQDYRTGLICAVCGNQIMGDGDRYIHTGEVGAAHEFGMDPKTGGVTMIAAYPQEATK